MKKLIFTGLLVLTTCGMSYAGVVVPDVPTQPATGPDSVGHGDDKPGTQDAQPAKPETSK